MGKSKYPQPFAKDERRKLRVHTAELTAKIRGDSEIPDYSHQPMQNVYRALAYTFLECIFLRTNKGQRIEYPSSLNLEHINPEERAFYDLIIKIGQLVNVPPEEVSEASKRFQGLEYLMGSITSVYLPGLMHEIESKTREKRRRGNRGLQPSDLENLSDTDKTNP